MATQSDKVADVALISLATRVPVASPNFWLEKHGQKARQPLFVDKAFDPLCVAIISPFMTHHNISLRNISDLVTNSYSLQMMCILQYFNSSL